MGHPIRCIKCPKCGGMKMPTMLPHSALWRLRGDLLMLEDCVGDVLDVKEPYNPKDHEDENGNEETGAEPAVPR